MKALFSPPSSHYAQETDYVAPSKEGCRPEHLRRTLCREVEDVARESRVDSGRTGGTAWSERSNGLLLGNWAAATKNFRLAENSASSWCEKSKRHSTNPVKNIFTKKLESLLTHFQHSGRISFAMLDLAKLRFIGGSGSRSRQA